MLMTFILLRWSIDSFLPTGHNPKLESELVVHGSSDFGRWKLNYVPDSSQPLDPPLLDSLVFRCWPAGFSITVLYC